VAALAEGGRQVALGLVVGLGPARLVTTAGGETMGTLLVGVTPNDTLTYASVLLLVATVSLFALFVPARRATRIQPATALRAE
jgi:ABC-type antimicrobial peptide transport system permease subunit